MPPFNYEVNMAKVPKFRSASRKCNGCTNYINEKPIRYDYSPCFEASERPVNRKDMAEIYGELNHKVQRRDERAMKRVRDMHSSFFAGLDPRRRQEVADAGMIQEDDRAIANLPQNFINREYSDNGFYETPYLDDITDNEY
jgi:hypothetical protein